MNQFLLDFWNVISMYVQFLFSLKFIGSVSVGSILLLALIFFVIVKAFWVRG